MLLKITNSCHMGCSHCMENSTPAGEHMTEQTFHAALDCVERMEGLAYAMGIPRMLLFSGGECTEHPDFVAYLDEAEKRDFIVTIITNGMWLADAELSAAILRPGRRVMVQVTNDPRFYPSAPPESTDSRVTRVPAIAALIPLGRAANKVTKLGLPSKGAPSSFNFRSLTRSLGDARAAIAHMRMRAWTKGINGHCSPSISADGEFVAGETRNCFAVGTVHSSPEEITRRTIEMQCNRCGLVTGLTPEQKRAIGESVLYGANEG